MQWYNYSYYAVLIAGIMAAFLRYRVLKPSQQLLAFALISIFVSEVVGRVFKELYSSNITVYSIARPITFILVGLAFDYELKTKWIRSSIFLYLIFHTLNLIFIQPFGQVYDSYSMNIGLMINTIWCLSYLYLIFKLPVVDTLFQIPLFWPTCGYLLFNAATMVVFATLNYTNNSVFKSAFVVLQTIKIVASHLLYLTFLIEFLSSKLRKS